MTLSNTGPGDLAARVMAAKRHSVARIAAAPILRDPFPHMVVDEIFPADFYAELRNRLPDTGAYRRLAETTRVSPAYSPQRFCLFPEDLPTSAAAPEDKEFWKTLFAAYCDKEFIVLWQHVFQETIMERVAAGMIPGELKDKPLSAVGDISLMRDLTSYRLLPHTDSPVKVVSVLFYLPGGDADPGLGTALYTPKTAGFTDVGGPHLPRDAFDLVTVLPYRPNTMVAFPKSAACFHGVEPVRDPGQCRDLMLYNVKFAPPDRV